MWGELSQRARDIWVIPCQHTIKSIRDIYIVFLPDIIWSESKLTPWENIGLLCRNPITAWHIIKTWEAEARANRFENAVCSARQPALCPVPASHGDLYEKLSERRTRTRNMWMWALIQTPIITCSSQHWFCKELSYFLLSRCEKILHIIDHIQTM